MEIGDLKLNGSTVERVARLLSREEVLEKFDRLNADIERATPTRERLEEYIHVLNSGYDVVMRDGPLFILTLPPAAKDSKLGIDPKARCGLAWTMEWMVDAHKEKVSRGEIDAKEVPPYFTIIACSSPAALMAALHGMTAAIVTVMMLLRWKKQEMDRLAEQALVLYEAERAKENGEVS